MSVNIVDKTTGELTRVAGNATDKVGNLNALTTIDKTSIVGGVNEVNGKIAFPTISSGGVNDIKGENVQVSKTGNYAIVTFLTSSSSSDADKLTIEWIDSDNVIRIKNYINNTIIKEAAFTGDADPTSEALTLRDDATAVNLFNNAQVTKWGKIVIVDFDIRLSSAPSSDLVICDYVFPAAKSSLRVTGQVTPENASAKGLAVRIDAGTHKLTIRGGDVNVVYFVRLVYITP